MRPPKVMSYRELLARYRRVRRHLPAALKHIRFGAATVGRNVVDALNYLHATDVDPKRELQPPLEVINAEPKLNELRKHAGGLSPPAFRFWPSPRAP